MRKKKKRGQAALFGGKPEWRDFTPPLLCSISVELLFLGRTGQRRHAGLSSLDGRGDIVKVAGADFLLM